MKTEIVWKIMVNMGPLLNTKFCTSRIDDKSKSLGKVFERQHMNVLKYV